MAVTQRFYPSFFMYALSNSGALSQNVGNEFTVSLFDEGAVFNPVNNTLDSVQGYKLDNTTQLITINVSRDGFRILFDVPEIVWSSLPNESFQHVIVYKQILGKLPLLFMHFDLGDPKIPTGGNFIFTPDGACIPNIDFDYQVCI